MKMWLSSVYEVYRRLHLSEKHVINKHYLIEYQTLHDSSTPYQRPIRHVFFRDVFNLGCKIVSNTPRRSFHSFVETETYTLDKVHQTFVAAKVEFITIIVFGVAWIKVWSRTKHNGEPNMDQLHLCRNKFLVKFRFDSLKIKYSKVFFLIL